MATVRKRILVTGGAGFLGSHLCEKLLRGGHDVLCVDNFFTGSKDNVAHLMPNPRFEVMRHDITFPLYVEVDEIYNLACPASPVHYQFDPVQTTKVSVIGTINMLGLAKRVGARILQASTSEIYGDPTVHPQPETYRGNVNPLGPRACYDEGKRCAETLCFDYARPQDDPVQRCPDITRAKQLLGWAPKIGLDEGLRRTISYFLSQPVDVALRSRASASAVDAGAAAAPRSGKGSGRNVRPPRSGRAGDVLAAPLRRGGQGVGKGRESRIEPQRPGNEDSPEMSG